VSILLWIDKLPFIVIIVSKIHLDLQIYKKLTYSKLNLLEFILPHHLKTPTRHGTPNDILVVRVEEVVTAQLDAELLELLAYGDMVQHVGGQVVSEELLRVVGSAAAASDFYGVA